MLIYKPDVMSRAVWKISLSYFFHAASFFSPSKSAAGAANLPSSLMAASFSATLLWKRLNMIRITPTPGGMPSMRLSAKQSGFSFPSLNVRMVSCISWLLPYRGDISKYDDVFDLLMSR